MVVVKTIRAIITKIAIVSIFYEIFLPWSKFKGRYFLIYIFFVDQNFFEKLSTLYTMAILMMMARMVLTTTMIFHTP